MDSFSATALREGVDGLIALANQLKAQSPANVPVMNDVEQSLAAYRTAFDEFVSLSQAKDLALEAKKWNVNAELRLYTDERVAAEDFKAGQCELVTLSLLPFGWFVVSLFSCIHAAV